MFLKKHYVFIFVTHCVYFLLRSVFIYDGNKKNKESARYEL